MPTMGGRLSSARFLAASVAASGRSIANQYTVEEGVDPAASLAPAVVCDASSMSSFARAGVSERPQHVAGPQIGESGVVPVGQ